MSFPESLCFTNGGREAQLAALAGKPLIFTSVRLGDGEMTGTISAKTELINERAAVNVNAVSANSEYATISAIFKNSDLSEGFYWKELGVYVANPDAPDDRNADILYAYQNVGVLAELIPSPSTELIEKFIHIPVFVGDVESVSVVVNSIVQQEATEIQQEEKNIEDVDFMTFFDKTDVKNKKITFENIKKIIIKSFNSTLTSLLKEKAPEGFGLGTMCKSVNSIFDIKSNGWWLTKGDTPDGNCWLCLSFTANNTSDNNPETIVIQAKSVTGNMSARRSKTNGVWGPWEWDNPPTNKGVEYRTTERLSGKPVYKKLVEFGSAPINSTKKVAHGCANVESVIDWSAFNVSSGSNISQSDAVESIYIDETHIHMTTNSNKSNWTMRFIMKYTKKN